MVWEWSTIVVKLLKTLQMKKLLSFCVLLLCTTIYAQVPSYVPTNGLVGYWPFNGNANDESGNGNNGVVNGATLAADRMGNPNSCYQLFTPAGSGGFIQLDQINLNDDFTITAWVTVESYTPGSVSTIISKYPANGSGYELDIDNETGVRGIYGIVGPENNVNNSVISNYSFDLNSWGHIVWSKEGTISKIYFNGTLIHEQVNVNPTSTNNGPNFFGKSQWGGNQLRGKLDDVAVYNRALTQQEITAMYNGETYSDTCNSVSGSLTQGLVGYWPFCGNANDDSGHGNNGSVNGATLTTDRFGNSNSAYDFDGLTSYISGAGVNLPQGDTARTVSLWVKTAGGFSVNTGGQTGAVFDYGTLENNKRFSVLLVDNDFTNYFSAAYNDFHPDSSIGNNVWTNIVWVYSATNLKLYLNGVPSSTGTISNLNTTGQNFVIGNTIPNSIGQYEKYKGAIDDIGIWNRALTPSEISQLYNQNQCFTNTTVTDTLIINLGQLSYTNPIAYANNITLYPNPANTQVNISFNNVTDLTGGTINIINSLGQQVATTPITLSGTSTTLSLTTWGGTGLYFVQILNAQGQILDIKKIILQ